MNPESSLRATLLRRIAAFCTQHGVLRTEFGQLAGTVRDFIYQLERDKPVTLGRIEKAEAFMARVDADPASLAGLREAAGLKPEPRRGSGAALAPGETAEEAGKVAGGAVHDGTVSALPGERHREDFPSGSVGRTVAP